MNRLEQQYCGRSRRDQLSVITAVPIGGPQAEGRAPGMYRSQRVGSCAGVLIFDPAKGKPVVAGEVLAPWGLVIVSGPDLVEPPEGGMGW